MPPAPSAETEEEANARRQQHEQQRKEYEAEQERRAEEFRQQQEREEQEYEAEQARREQLRKARAATFERILENAPETLNAAQLRVLLRAIVNVDPYTFADAKRSYCGKGMKAATMPPEIGVVLDLSPDMHGRPPEQGLPVHVPCTRPRRSGRPLK